MGYTQIQKNCAVIATAQNVGFPGDTDDSRNPGGIRGKCPGQPEACEGSDREAGVPRRLEVQSVAGGAVLHGQLHKAGYVEL